MIYLCVLLLLSYSRNARYHARFPDGRYHLATDCLPPESATDLLGRTKLGFLWESRVVYPAVYHRHVRAVSDMHPHYVGYIFRVARLQDCIKQLQEIVFGYIFLYIAIG